MDSSRLLLLTCVCSLLSLTCGAEVSELESRSLRNFYPKDSSLSSEKELLSELHSILERIQSKILAVPSKWFLQLSTCDIGEQCAVRKGARIGKLCDCPRSTGCNFFLLKCL
uniref:Cocaine- and amphetamine-regulated transcript 3 n=1 Tax=Callorhinchus milii TaxID=7868 RepID=A0A4W3HNP3_CALMI